MVKSILTIFSFYTSTKSWRDCILTSVGLSAYVCVCLSVCEQNADRTTSSILSLLQTISNIINCINIGTIVLQHKIHLTIKVKVTLTDGEDHT